MSNPEDAQPSAPPCTHCGGHNVHKMSDKEDVILWCCNRCGTIFGTPK